MFENFKLIFEILAFKKQSIETVAKKRSATVDGILILFFTAIMSVIGAKPILEKEELSDLHFEFTLNNVFFIAILIVISFVFYFGFSFLIAKTLGGKCQFKEYFRAMSFASIVNALSIFGALTLSANLLMIVLNFYILRVLNRFNLIQATLTIIASWLGIFALAVLLS